MTNVTNGDTVELRSTDTPPLNTDNSAFDLTTNSPPFFLRDSRASETRAREKITPPHRVSPFLQGVIFTRARVSLSLLSLRTNEGLLVV